MEEMEINAESKILVEYIPKVKKPELLQKKDSKNDIYLIQTIHPEIEDSDLFVIYYNGDIDILD